MGFSPHFYSTDTAQCGPSKWMPQLTWPCWRVLGQSCPGRPPRPASPPCRSWCPQSPGAERRPSHTGRAWPSWTARGRTSAEGGTDRRRRFRRRTVPQNGSETKYLPFVSVVITGPFWNSHRSSKVDWNFFPGLYNTKSNNYHYRFYLVCTFLDSESTT